MHTPAYVSYGGDIYLLNAYGIRLYYIKQHAAPFLNNTDLLIMKNQQRSIFKSIFRTRTGT
jgi:hypothetical protein